MDEDRLTALEMLAAEQEKIIEELSAEVTRQWREMEELRRKLDRLTERFLALEEQTAPDVPVTKPPHW
ncbi:SlyX family protein [Nitratireductor sp. ZSWI3]|uniref:SlyX family protein n=1 Tax=Nitratireductor sp. ZSWI3 TaxID=2966359 RepID=UPI00215065DD|nr:SlyX family protein [Nitratireductor sp. ZSWI3]MCR4266357.1 SlyX family protein [Nitratireductor sp. ZSWI3]